MIKMISQKSHRYGTRQLQADDEFEARGESDARLMTALGWAKRKTEEPPIGLISRPGPVTGQGFAKPQADYQKDEAEPVKAKRSYTRRVFSSSDLFGKSDD